MKHYFAFTNSSGRLLLTLFRAYRLGRVLLAAFGLLFCHRAVAQLTLANTTIEVSAEVQSFPPRIKLQWKPDASATSYDVYRTHKGSSLGFAHQVVTATTGTAPVQEFIDNTVVVGQAYEYRVSKNYFYGTTYVSGTGMVLAGIEVPAPEHRGTVILLVDATHATYLAPDLTQLQADLVGDGWSVVRHDVPAAYTPPQVKALIQADYLAAPTQVQTVFIVGHVAVPYSGNLNPDAHPDHIGAWPADLYYGDMGGTWTDTQVNSVSAARPENRNVPGDGKFDQTYLPHNNPNGGYLLELQVGRVDLSRLPAFALSERDLLRRYLLKDHQYRHRQFAVAERGLVDDQFGLSTGESFANNGWRNFAPMFGIGAGSTTAGAYFSTLRTADYLWAYACGSGNYNRIGGVGTTADFASGPVKSVFNMHYGSYFGDWDNSNNYLRAALAADGYTLTNCWAGRPDWYFYQMGLGETVGYCARTTLTYNPFTARYGNDMIHSALMGDPTLRLHTLAPATNLSANAAGLTAALTWTASPDATAGYYVYRATTAAGIFQRISAQLVTTTTYTDAAPLPGTSYYQVRAVQLKTSASGSYYNLSQGVLGTFTAPPALSQVWLGTSSADWHTPANWSGGQVPIRTGNVTVASGTPFAPVVSRLATAGSLTLGPAARLTVAAGGGLIVRDQPVVQPALTGSPLTALALAAGTASLPGGQLTVRDNMTSTRQGLLLATGTALSVGNGAEVRLLGSFGTTGAAVSFAPQGRLVFDHDSSIASPSNLHYFSASPALGVGVLRLGDPRETLVLDTPMEIISQAENLGLVITNGNLTLRSTLGQQGMLSPFVPGPGLARTFGRYTGAVAVQVYVDGSRNPGRGYRHLTTPVTGPSLMALATSAFTPVVNQLYNTVGNTVVPFPTVFTYDTQFVSANGGISHLAFDSGWQSPTNTSDQLVAGQGLTVNMPGNATLRFSGTPLNTSLTLDYLGRNNPENSGWHLLGNPYPAPLNWNLLVAGGPNFIDMNPALYVFKSSGIYTGSYASYLPGTGGAPGTAVNGGSPIVPVGQAFFVRTKVRFRAGSVGFSLDHVLTSSAAPTVQRTAVDARPRLALALQNPAGTLAHETAIYFQAGATPGEDAAYDAPYLAGPGQALALVSEAGGHPYAINGLPTLTGADVLVPLTLSAAAAGSYHLAVQALAALPTGYHAYLRDSQTGTLTDLAATPVVSVALPANTVVRHYAVLFSGQSQALAAAAQSLGHFLTIAPNPAHGTAILTLPLSGRNGMPVAVQVRNALGQLVLAHILPAATETLVLPLSALAPGMYTVQAHLAQGPATGRLVVE